jgi:hypothetical protein
MKAWQKNGIAATRPTRGPTRPILEFSRAAAWSAWLTSNHARSQGVFLRIPKTGAKKAIPYAGPRCSARMGMD